MPFADGSPHHPASGDGWVLCAEGHRHWGLFGAAGVLISDGPRVILQHRAPWTHQGDSWGVPGGARDSHESSVEAALREVVEEVGLDPNLIIPVGMYIDDHGGWAYTTVVARAPASLQPHAANAESVAVDWIDKTQVADLALHDGFAGAWPRLRAMPDPLHLLVPHELLSEPTVQQLTRNGIAADRLPTGIDFGQLTRLIPAVRPIRDRADAAQSIAELGDSAQVVIIDGAGDLHQLG